MGNIEDLATTWHLPRQIAACFEQSLIAEELELDQ